MSDTPAGADGFPLFVDDRHDLPLQLHFELDDRPLSVWAFRVYAHFVRRAGRNGRIYPTYKSIAETCFRSTFPDAKPETLRRRAMEAVKELEGQGLIRVHRSKAADGDNNPNTYFLTPRSAWHPLVQCTPPSAMHPPGATHPEVNQVQANQDSRKEGAENRRAGQEPTPSESDTHLPPVGNPSPAAPKAGITSPPTASEKVPGGGAAARAEEMPLPGALTALPGFAEAWAEWLAYRRARRLTTAPATLKRQLGMLAEQPDPLAVIEQSITQGWAGLFPLKAPAAPRTQADANARAVQTAQAVYNALQEDTDVPF